MARSERSSSGGGRGAVPLYEGIELSYTDTASGPLPCPCAAPGRILQIDHCRAGQIEWRTARGVSVFLDPGDYAVRMLGDRADLPSPTGRYQGLTIRVDLREVSAHPPGPIAEIFGGPLPERLRRSGAAVFLAGNERSESIFSGFYGQPEHLRLPYQRVKVLELLLYLAQIEAAPQDRLPEYRAGQVEVVREIHDQLLHHMEQRITIEELSRQYLIDPTTLKAAFKAVYGTPLASHIKRHRMEQAAKLLRETDMSIAEIARAVGYDSPSRFTSSFKAVFQILPKEYRRSQL